MAVHTTGEQPEDLTVVPRFTRAGMLEVPKDRIPDTEMLPETAYQIVMDEVMLDGNARFNLATFVTTWMDEEADRLYAATFDKNMVDKDEYPQTAEIEARCVRMLGELGTPRTRPTAWGPRRPAAPRGACSAGSRSSVGGSRRGARPAGRWARRTS